MTNFKEVIMKKTHIIISCVLVVGIIFSGLAFAAGQRTGHRKSVGYKHHFGYGGLQLLARYQQKDLMVQALAEMTGQSIESIQLKLEDQRMHTLMRDLNVDRQAFREAVQAKEKERIKQAVSDGSITSEQEKEILVKMETRSKRHALMKKLIEKGIEDGTITQDEARMLRRKRR
jgi:hypothetical protein